MTIHKKTVERRIGESEDGQVQRMVPGGWRCFHAESTMESTTAAEPASKASDPPRSSKSSG